MEVRFRRFRCFRDTGKLGLARITFLVGGNGSGKTSFMAGLHHLCSLMDNIDAEPNTGPFELGSFGDICNAASVRKGNPTFEYECATEDRSLRWVFGNDHDVPSIEKVEVRSRHGESIDSLRVDRSGATITLDYVPGHFREVETDRFSATLAGKGSRRMEIRMGSNSGSVPAFIRDSLLTGPPSPGMPGTLGRHVTDLMCRADGSREGRGPRTAPADREFHRRLDALMPVGTRGRGNPVGSTTVTVAPPGTEPRRIYAFGRSASGNAGPHGENLPARLSRLRNSRDWRAVSRELAGFGRKAGLFRDIDIERLGKDSDHPFSIVVTTRKGQTSNLADAGYGVSRILPLVLDLLTARDSRRYLVQQPEAHLHPKAQAELASLVARRDSGHSFVIETHSDHMLERMKYEIGQGTVPNREVGILFFETSGANVKVHRIELGENGLPVNAPPSYRKFLLEEMDRNWA